MKKILILTTLLLSSTLHADHETIETNDEVLRDLLKQHKEGMITRQPWRPIQEEVRDTVVQVFAQVAEIDILQPYKTPSQYCTRGSGFFINERGDIITNAHVVDQAVALWIQIPSLGRRIIDVYLVSVCPDRDLALLRVTDESLAIIQAELGVIPYLSLGDSDSVRRADEVLALGYPLGQESLKSTTGVISGREKNMIQISAPINPGSSGGPLLNVHGKVVGINSAGVIEAQNVGYIIPINDLKVILDDLYRVPLLRKPFMGIFTESGTDTLTEYLHNPRPGGCYVVEVVNNSPAAKAGILQGDMIYAINGYPVDIYGDIRVPWSEDKISIINYASRLALGDTVEFLLYRNGEHHSAILQITQSDLLPIRKVYPGYEAIEYEVFGGMVVMELTLNHIKLMANHATGLTRFNEIKHQNQPVLVITHIFPNSQLYRTRTLAPSFTIHEVNGQEVHSLNDFRNALALSFNDNYFTIKASDNISKLSDNMFVVLPFDLLLKEELQLSRIFHYPISEAVKKLIAATA